MNYQVFSENEWIYPDSPINTQNTAELHSARGADTCFQVLTDHVLQGGEKITVHFALTGCCADVYQLLTATVPLNSHAKALCTDDYDSVKHFVTRKAPFDVYEITRPLDEGETEAGRAAFFVRINVACDAPVGTHACVLTVHIGDKTLRVPICLKIYNVCVPARQSSEFHMVNWIYYDRVANDHGVEIYSDQYMEILDRYFENQIDMRNDFLMIPSGEPVRDGSGRVIDFDFSHAELVGNRALAHGFTYIMGGFVARFKVWNDPDHLLLWDKDVTVTSIEGYRQLKMYFTRAYECILRNGWEKSYMQCLVDEPQFPNSLAYRALSGICRKCIPGVMINDPVESCDLAGAIDVWVVKQAVYEKYIEEFQKLQNAGENMWIYTCGFPAGYTMNRVIDLPLAASRLPMWMCYKYGAPGFLHWGYHVHNPDGRYDTNYHTDGVSYPAGNAHVVYPVDRTVWNGVRAHLQRAGAIDYELLAILGKHDKATALHLVDKVCRSFEDYEISSRAIDSVRRELLEAIDSQKEII
ncbi:MAG: DUF4091 domain-containing protein [Clostridia bacterium]|nr:DUF4091 domain-containing protein [Clostridia bacterium]